MQTRQLRRPHTCAYCWWWPSLSFVRIVPAHWQRGLRVDCCLGDNVLANSCKTCNDLLFVYCDLYSMLRDHCAIVCSSWRQKEEATSKNGVK